MIRALGLVVVSLLLASVCHGQQAAAVFTEACVTELESCEAKLKEHRRQVERFRAFKQTCEAELQLLNGAGESVKEAVQACQQTVEIREQQMEKLNKIESNLNQHSVQCMEGYTAAMKDYKSCVETSSFSLGKHKVFWVGLVLGLLIGVPIAI